MYWFVSFEAGLHLAHSGLGLTVLLPQSPGVGFPEGSLACVATLAHFKGIPSVMDFFPKTSAETPSALRKQYPCLVLTGFGA